MSITLTQFVAADDGEYTTTDSLKTGAAMKLDDRTRAVLVMGECRWGMVKSEKATLADGDAQASGHDPVAVEDGGSRWLKVEALGHTVKASKTAVEDAGKMSGDSKAGKQSK